MGVVAVATATLEAVIGNAAIIAGAVAPALAPKLVFPLPAGVARVEVPTSLFWTAAVVVAAFAQLVSCAERFADLECAPAAFAPPAA